VHRTISDLAILAEECANEATLEGLRLRIRTAVAGLGFDCFLALRSPSLQRGPSNPVIMLDHSAIANERDMRPPLFQEVAMIAASTHPSLGICWSDLGRDRRLTDSDLSTLAHGRAHGFESGFTICMSAVGIPDASFTVARASPSSVSDCEKIAVRAVAAIALEHGHRLTAIKDLPKRPSLTPRQRQCTVLVAQGKTDWEIGTIIGIGRDTVHEYIEAARKKYDVRTRPQLVLAAFRNGELHDLDHR
jgi:DNA-binding CsgD family transcriptional regulator